MINNTNCKGNTLSVSKVENIQYSILVQLVVASSTHGGFSEVIASATHTEQFV